MTADALPPNVITHGQPSLAGTAVVPDVPPPDVAPPDAFPSRPTGGWRLLVAGPVNKACVAVVALYVLVALATLVPGNRYHLPTYGVVDLAGFQYNRNAEDRAVPPSWGYADEAGHRHRSPAAWLGTDFAGHSVFWRVVYGVRTALLITVLTSLLVMAIGVTLGVVAGYFGGWVDDLITWFYAVLGTVPWMLLVLAVSYVLNQNAKVVTATAAAAAADPGPVAAWFGEVFPRDIVIVILSLGLTDWIGLCRLIRGETIKLRDSDMVAAARALGYTERRILFRHLLPNVSHLAIVSFTLGAVGYLQVEVVLAFLGLGVKTKPSWGRMIDDAKLSLLRGQWWEVASATAAIFVVCTALTLLGDALRDALDPKTRGRT